MPDRRDETIEAIRALTEALDEDEAASREFDPANPGRGVLATADLQYAVRHHLRTLLDHVAPLERERDGLRVALAADFTETFRAGMMRAHADEWDMETIAEAAYICNDALHARLAALDASQADQ